MSKSCGSKYITALVPTVHTSTLKISGLQLMHIKHQNLGFVGESLLIIQYTEAKPCLNFTKNSKQ